jgi:hypothetical protein
MVGSHIKFCRCDMTRSIVKRRHQTQINLRIRAAVAMENRVHSVMFVTYLPTHDVALSHTFICASETGSLRILFTDNSDGFMR